MPVPFIPVTGLRLGFVGDITHEGMSIRSPRSINSTDTLNVAFGETVVLNANNSYSSVKQFIANGGTFTAALPLGIAVRNLHTQTGFPLSGGAVASAGFYVPSQAADVCVIGTVGVAVNNGTPTGAGGTVYLRIAANGAILAGVIGGLEAVADGANTVALTNVKFKTGFMETDGSAEVTILARTIA